MTKDELTSRLKSYQEQAKQALAMHYRYDGAAQECAAQIKMIEQAEAQSKPGQDCPSTAK